MQLASGLLEPLHTGIDIVDTDIALPTGPSSPRDRVIIERYDSANVI
ncbi:MAG: hypothetical protein NVSMB6_26970 [Burkholderiaceae bacterium]